MTDIKLDSKITAAAAAGLLPHAQALFDNQGARLMIVAELAHLERVEPNPDLDGKASVKLRIVSLEVGAPEQDDALREAQRALYLCRTAAGTLDPDGEVELSERTLAGVSGRLLAERAAAVLAGVRQWADYANRALGVSKPQLTEVLHELRAVADGLEQLAARTEADL